MNEKYISVKALAPVLAIAVLAGGVSGAFVTKMQLNGTAVTEDGVTRITEKQTYVEESETIKAIEKVGPAVLSIVATKDLQVFRNQPLDPFFFFENDPMFRNFGRELPQQRQQQQKQTPQEPQTQRQRVSGGTGFIIQQDGLALTNKHVVADTDADYSALTTEGKEYDVEVISRDPVNDLAIIQLHEKTAASDEDKNRKTGEAKKFGDKPENMTVAPLGDSTKLRVGQKVLAIGNARGEYENSVTAGIVSATGREIQASDSQGGSAETLSGLIQTDAAINFGNSGGPLINLAGEVIGVNTAIDASATGIGFAIPVNQVKPVIDSVKKHGRIIRPVLGVMHTILTKERAKELKLDDIEHGALITGDRAKKEFGVVPGSPAEKAGLKLDDVILEVDGEKVTENNTLQSMVQKHMPGDKLKLTVWRDRSSFEVEVTLEERKE